MKLYKAVEIKDGNSVEDVQYVGVYALKWNEMSSYPPEIGFVEIDDEPPPSEITEGEVEVIDILTRLVNLKAHKDKYGKDKIYIKEQPILWDKAKAILATLNK